MNTNGKRIWVANITALFRPFVIAAGLVLAAGTVALSAEPVAPTKPAAPEKGQQPAGAEPKEPAPAAATVYGDCQLVATRNIRAFFKPEGGEEFEGKPSWGPYCRVYATLEANRLYTVRFEPAKPGAWCRPPYKPPHVFQVSDYAFLNCFDRLLKVGGTASGGYHDANGNKFDVDGKGDYATILGLPLPSRPFYIRNHSGPIEARATEVKSLAELKAFQPARPNLPPDASWNAYFIDTAASMLYMKVKGGLGWCYLIVEDPSLVVTPHIERPRDGETVSGMIELMGYFRVLDPKTIDKATGKALELTDKKEPWRNSEAFRGATAFGFSVDGEAPFAANNTLMLPPPYANQIATTMLLNGPHTIHGEVTLTSGETIKTPKVTIHVDNTKPSVFLVGYMASRNSTYQGPLFPCRWVDALLSGQEFPVAIGVANLKASKVELYVDGVLKGTDSTGKTDFPGPTAPSAGRLDMTAIPTVATHLISLDTTALKDGPHELTVKAYDAEGKPKAEQTTRVFVYNEKRSIRIMAPAAGETVSGTIVALASPPDGCEEVCRGLQFNVDGVKQGEENLLHAPLFGVNIDTTKLSNGPHELDVMQGDMPVNRVHLRSEKISFTVDNSRPAVFLTHRTRIEAPKLGAYAARLAKARANATNQARLDEPWPGRILSGTVPLTAGVANLKTVGKVEFLVDGTVKETDSTAPFAATLDTAKLADGAHEVTLKAYDASGKQAAAQTTKVFVCNQGAIRFLAPSAGKPVSGVFTALAAMPEARPVRWMQFLVDGVAQGEDNLLMHAPPFGVDIDTGKLTDGPHVLEAVAGYGHLIPGYKPGEALHPYTTEHHAYLCSEKFTFTVDNSVPAVALTHQERVEAPWPGRTLSGTVPLAARVANMKAGKVEFLVDGTLKATDAASLEDKRKADLAEIEGAQRAIFTPAAQAVWEQIGVWAGPWWSVEKYQAASAHETFTKDFEPEHGVDLSKPTSDGKTWVAHPEWDNGRTVMKKDYAASPNATATYMYRVINAKAATTLPLSLGNNSSITVWVNGKQVLAREEPRGMEEANHDKLSIELKPGTNTLLLKKVLTGSMHGMFGFYFKAPLLELPLEISTILLLPEAQRSPEQRAQVAAYYGNTAPALAGARRHLAELQQQLLAREKDPTQWPYGASIDTTKLTEGAHELTVKAYDAAGKLAASQTTKVTVTNAVEGGVK